MKTAINQIKELFTEMFQKKQMNFEQEREYNYLPVF